MHRIDTPTAQADKFGPGKNGFTGGNPQTGQLPTALDEDFFDMLQEELASVVEATGVALDKAEHNQLLTALKALLLSRSNPFGEIKADGAAAVALALANLGLGEAAKRGVGTGANQIPDMSAWTSSFSAGTPATGWRKSPDGFIEQYISVVVPAGAGARTLPVTFPLPFPNLVIGIEAPLFKTADPSSRFVGFSAISKIGIDLSVVTATENAIFFRVTGR